MIRDESYIHIWWWMLNRLNLKWNELLVYATIYSFTNWTDDHCFHWSAWYLAEWCWLQRRQVMRILKTLEEKWYIERKDRIDNWVKFVDYYTPYVKITQGGYVKITHHIIDIDNDSISESEVSPDGENQETANPLDANPINNKPFKKKKPSKGENNFELDIPKICDADSIRELFDEDEISMYKYPLKILLKMVDLWYEIKKDKNEVKDFIEWTKEKAKIYNIKQPDGNIARATFYQRVDKRHDWHIENNQPVKNFKTSIIPFISRQ